MFPVDTIFVASVTSRATALDQLAALKWTCRQRTQHIILVDCAKRPCLAPGTFDGYSVVRQSSTLSPGFQSLAALRTILTGDAQFGQAILLDDEALPVGLDLDMACAGIVQAGAGLLGVEDRLCYYESFRTYGPQFSDWELPHELWEEAPSPKTPAAGFLVLSASLVWDLLHRDLLPPADISGWQLPFEPWLSWVAQMLNHSQVLHGHMDRPKPPFYVNALRGRYLPPPTILGGDFLLFRSLHGVTAFSAADLRQFYRQMRGG